MTIIERKSILKSETSSREMVIDLMENPPRHLNVIPVNENFLHIEFDTDIVVNGFMTLAHICVPVGIIKDNKVYARSQFLENDDDVLYTLTTERPQVYGGILS